LKNPTLRAGKEGLEEKKEYKKKIRKEEERERKMGIPQTNFNLKVARLHEEQEAHPKFLAVEKSSAYLLIRKIYSINAKCVRLKATIL